MDDWSSELTFQPFLSADLKEVPVKYEIQQDELQRLKNQPQGNHQEALATILAQAAQLNSPGSVTPTVNADVAEADQAETAGSKSFSALRSAKIHNDIYRWKQYGRIQLKSPKGSRSYHKCKYSGCNAKKIETSDQFNSVPKIVYKGQHKHDGKIELTPQSLKRKSISRHEMIADVEDADQEDISLSASRSVKIPNEIYGWKRYGRIQLKSPEGSRSYYKCTYSACKAKKIETCDQNDSIPKIVYKGQHKHDAPKRVVSSRLTRQSLTRKIISTHGLNADVILYGVNNTTISLINRVEKTSSASPGSVPKQPKKPNFIVHAAADIEVSADGYNWKSYGQMIVKGSPHRRKYYKCTSAGCTVKKYIEKANDGTSQVILTYNGVHNHNIPASKKR